MNGLVHFKRDWHPLTACDLSGQDITESGAYYTPNPDSYVISCPVCAEWADLLLEEMAS